MFKTIFVIVIGSLIGVVFEQATGIHAAIQEAGLSEWLTAINWTIAFLTGALAFS